MYQKEAAKAAWTAAGHYASRDPDMIAFLEQVDGALECWKTLGALIRTKYPQLLEAIVLPLWQTGDKLLRVNIMRHLDPARAEESALALKFARRLDAADDRPELAEVARSRMTAAIMHLSKRKDAPAAIHALAEQRLVVLAQEAQDTAAEALAAQPPPAPAGAPAPPVRPRGSKRGRTARAKRSPR